jgi:hypothetical protein
MQRTERHLPGDVVGCPSQHERHLPSLRAEQLVADVEIPATRGLRARAPCPAFPGDS